MKYLLKKCLAIVQLLLTYEAYICTWNTIDYIPCKHPKLPHSLQYAALPNDHIWRRQIDIEITATGETNFLMCDEGFKPVSWSAAFILYIQSSISSLHTSNATLYKRNKGFLLWISRTGNWNAVHVSPSIWMQLR